MIIILQAELRTMEKMCHSTTSQSSHGLNNEFNLVDMSRIRANNEQKQEDLRESIAENKRKMNQMQAIADDALEKLKQKDEIIEKCQMKIESLSSQLHEMETLDNMNETEVSQTILGANIDQILHNISPFLRIFQS